MNTIDLKAKLLGACAGGMSALRMIATFQPIGGEGDKVAPPTHDKGRYAFEERVIDGRQNVKTVLLDSVQSQANRFEEALLSRLRAGDIRIPLLEVDIPNRETLTSLSVPHRVHDAIFRDCTFEGKRYYDSDLGKQIAKARTWNATAMFRVCPTALLFGTWDSQSKSGVNSAKFARALVSEIIGIDVIAGVRTSSRIDPLGIKKLERTIYESATEQWTLEKLDKAKLYGKSGSPSDINHGNIPPTITDVAKGEGGGVTFRIARQTAVLSFAQLRKLRFPLGDTLSPEIDAAGRAVIAALGVYALTLQIEEGYQLRSRCHLQPVTQPEFKWLGATSAEEGVAQISTATAKETAEALYEHAKSLGLYWSEKPLKLEPEAKLLKLVEKSDRSNIVEE